jgi:pSer/pThr/pTyr-binding forkhead associated (FHA) protein
MKKSKISSNDQPDVPEAVPQPDPSLFDTAISDTVLSKDITAELEDIFRHVHRRLDMGEAIDGLAFLQLYAQYADQLKSFLLELAAQGKRVYLKPQTELEDNRPKSTAREVRESIAGTPTDKVTDNSQTLDLAGPSRLRENDSRQVPRYRPSLRPPMAVVVMYFDGDMGSTSYPIMSDRFAIGRKEGDLIIGHEMWMSGRHAEIQRRKIGKSHRWYLVDQNSTNGSFVRTDAVVLKDNDELFLGSERYRFFSQEAEVGLLHVTRGAAEKWVFTNSCETIGTQANSKMECMLSDPYLDTVHARIAKDSSGVWSIRNNNSQNGVWYRIREFELTNNNQFQLGEQRFEFKCVVA